MFNRAIAEPPPPQEGHVYDASRRANPALRQEAMASSPDYILSNPNIIDYTWRLGN